MTFIKLLERFKLIGKNSFYPLESGAIEAVIQHLNEDAAEILKRQVAAINKIQRLIGDKEVDFYHKRNGKLAFDDRLCFPDKTTERLLATVQLFSTDKRRKLKIELWLVKGQLFCLTFDRSPKVFFGPKEFKSIQPEIAEVNILIDPMNELGP